MSPQTIAHYRITTKLGEGGMGAVYQATDTKLNRDVAIKVLPEVFAGDPERLTRFTREAHVLASLNHPNIAAIYGVEERALVMELVDGPTLAERMAEGAIPLEEALPIARQIADALEYAHEKGIIHRDLKPANIKVTPEGRVKLLDFGLAKALGSDMGAGDPGASPTLSMGSTHAGVILGTAGYMSPEQARGRKIDRRADIWAFGVVLYEMVTGARLFHRDTLSDSLAAVLKEEPEWSKAPLQTQRLLRWCLEKDPQRRLRDIGDARLLLEQPPEAIAGQPTNRAPWAVAALCAAAAVVFAIVAALALWWPGRGARTAELPLVRLSAELGEGALTGAFTTAAISRDGTAIAFPWRGAEGRQMLAIRRLDQSRVIPLPGTENGQDPFFSPDGRWIGFLTAGNLKKVLVQGGAPVTLANVFTARGATWDADGSIIAALTNRSALDRIPAAGGTPQPVTKLDPGELTHRWPQVLPGGHAVLFTGRSPTLNSYENASIDVVTLKTGARKTLWRGGYFGRYVPSRGARGHLVYLHEGTLFAVPFDPGRLELEGTPIPVVEDIASDPLSGGGQFDVSATGTMVYLAGGGAPAWMLVSLDAAGKTKPILNQAGMYYSPRFSPDGRKLALAVEAGSGSDIFIHDFARESMSRLTFNQQGNIEPVWTPDGKYIVYRSVRGGALWWVRADGGGEPRRLQEAPGPEIQACSFSPDGTRLAYQVTNLSTGSDVFILPLDLSDPDRPKPGQPQPLMATAAGERYPAFSPDGRFMAYQSDDSGVYEVYVRRVDGPAATWQISAGGGRMARWSHGGRQIFYQAPGNRIMVADYDLAGDSIVPRKPRLWSPTQLFDPGYLNLDIAPDGKRFAVFLPPPARTEKEGAVHVTFLLNFFDELRRRAAPGK